MSGELETLFDLVSLVPLPLNYLLCSATLGFLFRHRILLIVKILRLKKNKVEMILAYQNLIKRTEPYDHTENLDFFARLILFQFY